MNDGLNERQGAGPKVRRLSDAMRKVRIAEAERMDALSDLFDADRARLEMLADELAGVFGEIPKDDDFFICALAGSVPPRLWIDGTSHVVIGRDRRTYRFLKDTRLGRVVLGEGADVDRMADLVTDYVAERLIERERAKDSDAILGQMRAGAMAKGGIPTPAPAQTSGPAVPSMDTVTRSAPWRAAGGTPSEALRRVKAEERPSPGLAQRRGTALWLLVMFLFGIAAGILALLGYVWLRGPLA